MGFYLNHNMIFCDEFLLSLKKTIIKYTVRGFSDFQKHLKKQLYKDKSINYRVLQGQETTKETSVFNFYFD